MVFQPEIDLRKGPSGLWIQVRRASPAEEPQTLSLRRAGALYVMLTMESSTEYSRHSPVLFQCLLTH